MSVGSSVSAVWTISTWPMQALGGIQQGNMAAVAGAVAGLAVPFFVFGNPIPYAQDMDFVTLGFGYALGGVSYWGASMLVNKMQGTA